MNEKLDRKELPIQSIYQRGDAVTAIVPINLAVMDLSKRIRTDLSLIAGARSVIERDYNEDMDNYLGILRKDRVELPWLRDYEQFRDEWQLGAISDDEFLSLFWRENGEVHYIKFNPMPVVFHNQRGESEEFYRPDTFTKGGRLIEIAYRNISDPEIVLISPEKLRRYGRETDIARIDEGRGIAEVVGNAFTSDYYVNMAKTLLLRDFGVFYLNKLLDRANGSSLSR